MRYLDHSLVALHVGRLRCGVLALGFSGFIRVQRLRGLALYSEPQKVGTWV